MSGGAYDYAYTRIEDLARQIRGTTPLRRAFKTHLQLVAKAAHAIEWADSGDSDEPDAESAIRECFGERCNALVLAEVIAEGDRVLDELTAAMAATKHRRI